MLLDFSFFSFYDYLCMFHQPAKICPKSYNCIILKLIFLYLNYFGADFCPGTPKDIVPGDCKFSVKMFNTWIKKIKGGTIYEREG